MSIGIREFGLFIVLLAVPLLAWVFVFQPRNEQISEALKEIESRQASLDTVAEMAATIDDLEQAIIDGQIAIETVEQQLPARQDVEGILEQVWQLARRNNLQVNSIKGQSAVPAALYMEQPLAVVLEGPFEGFYQFLIEIENLPRIARLHELIVERIDVLPVADEPMPPPGSIRADLMLSIYFASNTSDVRAGVTP